MAELLFLITVILMYSGLNFYLYLRVQSVLIAWFPGVAPAVFTIAFWVLASLFILTQLSCYLLGYNMPEILVKSGYYWLAFLFYGILLAVFVDVMRLIYGLLPWLPGGTVDYRILGALIFLLVAGIVGWGAWNSRNPIITRYEVVIDKKAGNLDELKIAMVSDVHLGLVVDKARLAVLVKKINDLQPDLVVLPGDIIDGDLGIVIDAHMEEELRQLKAPFGVYACLGNHEYYSGSVSEVDRFMQQAGIKLLLDQVELIGDSFYLAGRNLKGENPMAQDKSLRLAQLLKDLDLSKPIFVMDHVPARIKEAAAAQVDLLMCGHTHLGQLWPLNQITRRVFISDYGHYKIGSFQAIISNGVGTWGPPIRVGNRPEIVEVHIKFKH